MFDSFGEGNVSLDEEMENYNLSTKIRYMMFTKFKVSVIKIQGKKIVEKKRKMKERILEYACFKIRFN